MNTQARRILRLSAIAVALMPLSLAQMGGGMTGSGVAAGTSGGMMGSGKSSSSDMGGNGMMGGMSGSMAGGMGGATIPGPVEGPDGTAYTLRRSGTISESIVTNQTVKAELIAINPSTGKTSWTLSIDGTMPSAPVLSNDGLTIFLTTSEPDMSTSASGNSTHGTGTSSTTKQKPALIIVDVTLARIQKRIEIETDMLSVPRIAPDGQTIYITGLDMPTMSEQAGTDSTTGAATLYAFSAAGTLKFQVDLGKLQMGSMAP